MKYYFFETFQPGGRGCTKLRALPGQTTYQDYSHRNEPLRTDRLVQANSHARGVMVQYPVGTVFGAAYPNGYARASRIPVHSDHGEQYYRLDMELRPLTAAPRDESHRPGGDMVAAYVVFISSANHNADAPAQETPAPAQDNAQAVSVSCAIADATITEETARRLAGLERGSLNAMLDHVDTFQKEVMLATLRDRMAVGAARFEYVKQDGTLRTAYGTRCQEIIGTNNPYGGLDRDSGSVNSVFHYFDIQKRAWRCFSVNSIKNVHDWFASTPAQLATIPEQGEAA